MSVLDALQGTEMVIAGLVLLSGVYVRVVRQRSLRRLVCTHTRVLAKKGDGGDGKAFYRGKEG